MFLKDGKPTKLLIWITTVVLIVAMLFTYNTFRVRPQLMVLSSGSPGGVYYPLGGAISEVVSRNLEDLRFDSESTSGSVENVSLIGNKESEMGMAMEDAVYNATNGEYPFSREYPVKVLFTMYMAPLHIITLQDSGIGTIEDMVGKRVSIGAPGSGTEAMARTLLEEFDLLADIDTVNYGQQEAAAALRDGNIDAVFWNFAYPASVVMEVSATHDLKFVSLENEQLEVMTDKYAYYSAEEIPAETYDNQDDPVSVLSVANVLIVHEDMEDELAYQLVKAIFDNLDRLSEVHDIANHFEYDTAVRTTVEMHPGAVKYFDEVE